MSKKLNGGLASRLRPERIDWLWPGRIARGKLTVIAGDPGLGTSQLACALAATVSNAGPWPCGEGTAPPGQAILVNAEDGPADTIMPRLIAAGARLDQVAVLDGTVSLGRGRRTLSLKADLDMLEDAMHAYPGAVLVVLDPISAFLGSEVDSHRQSDVRGLLAPLADFAALHGVAIVLVAHLNKGVGTDAMARVAGSGAFVAASRSTLLVTRDASDTKRRLLLPAKNNLGRDVGGLAFTVEGAEIFDGDGPIATSRIVWQGQTDITANEALRALAEGNDGGDDERSMLEEADVFLRQVLGNGALPALSVRQQAKDAGQSWITVRRAKERLKVRSIKTHRTGQWVWELPHDEHDHVEQHEHDASSSSSSSSSCAGPVAHRAQGARHSGYGNGEHLGPESPPDWDDDIPTAEVGP